jgi:hypothetical protein
MKTLASWLSALAVVLVVGASPVAAQSSAPARTADFRLLQDEVAALDDALQNMQSSNPRYQEFQDRADQIRDDITYLKVQMRRSRTTDAAAIGASRADVDALHREIAALRDDIEVAYDRRYTGASAVLAEGTDIDVRLDSTISSETARPEDRVEASVAQSVSLDNRTVVPVGTRVRGVVRSVERAQRPARGGRLEILFDSMLLPDGSRVDLRSRVISIKENLGSSDTKHRAGIGAVLGGVLGAVLKGTGGAVVGAVVGASGAVAASKGDEVVLPEGSLLTLRLDAPATISTRR